ncbi:MAG: cysteine desulfurase family protein [Candidatus Pacearchaeota archaeon]|nr:cysteine desulfurase family protein [Candidatus Pacearchaeota archaeon]
MDEIYLDNIATTRVNEKVSKVISDSLLINYGNPGSPHWIGEKAFKEMTRVRVEVAIEIGCKAHEIVFTSGATESNNLALQGVFMANKNKKNKIIISEIEHPSISKVCDFLAENGAVIKRIGVDSEGFVNLKELENEIDSKTLVVSIMHVNNIFGTIQKLREIGKICKKKGVLFHTDAVQGFGKLNINVRDLGIDMFTASGHKICAGKGIGFLYIGEDVKISPLIVGGGQEMGFRSGTENVPGIVGFGKALELVKKKDWRKVEKTRDLFISELEKIGGRINGVKGKNRIFNNIHVSFVENENLKKEWSSEDLIYRLSQKGIYVSAGSACNLKKANEDLILKAIGLKDKEIMKSIRIGLWDELSDKKVEEIVKKIDKLIKGFD